MGKERVLIVDDSKLGQKITKTLLEKEGYEVYVAEDGMQALGLIETRPPNLILMDIQLPGIDGTELTRLIRSEPGNKDIFIVALTAHEGPEWRQRALDAGCNAYLSKPVSIPTLREALSQRSEEMIPRPVEAVAVAVDKEALMTRLGGDRDLLRDLQMTFIEEYPRVNAQLHRHLEDRDSAALADAAHALKGMLSTFSAISAEHAAETLELAAASGDLTSAPGLLNDVGQQVERFMKSLAELVEASE